MLLQQGLLYSSSSSDSNYKGYYANLSELITAFPVGSEGWWAIVAFSNAIYVWNVANSQWETNSGYLPLSGGTMTGALTLYADPITNLQAATKQYVDSIGRGWKGTVATYSALPTASTHNGEVWLVTTASGVWPFNHPAGLYISNGTAWTEAPMVEGALVASTSLTDNVLLRADGTSGNVQSSPAFIDDLGNLTGINNITVGGLTANKAVITNGSSVLSTIDYTNLNTGSALVQRDASGNFSAGTISAALTGNSSTATALQTARTIGGVSFNGTANIVPQTIQSVNESVDTTCFPLFISASGSQSLQPLNNTSLTFNASNGNLGATTFSGAGTGLTGTAASLTAGTVTTNANLAGVITSAGNTTTITSQTGLGTKFVVDDSPTLITPNIGSASGNSLNLSGLTPSQLIATDASKNLVTLDTTIYPSPSELATVKGVTSAIQTQIDAKQDILTSANFGSFSASLSTKAILDNTDTINVSDSTTGYNAKIITFSGLKSSIFSSPDITGTLSVGRDQSQYIEILGDALYPVIRTNGSGANVPLILQSKGTGATQAQKTDLGIVGGNVRGSYAVDFQKIRSAATQIASGTNSVLVGGTGNTSSNTNSVVVGGSSNNASGVGATIGGGGNNVADSTNSCIPGGKYGNTRGIEGYFVFPASNTPFGAGSGLIQSGLLCLGAITTNATPAVAASSAAAASATNQLTVPSNAVVAFNIIVGAGVTGGGNAKSWEIKGSIKRGPTPATTALLAGSSVTITGADVGAATWTVAISANTTLGCLTVTVTGQAGSTIRWNATIQATEFTF